MKRARNYLAAVLLVFVAVACSSSPTAPDMQPNFDTPYLGSGN